MEYSHLYSKILSLPKDNTLYLLDKFPGEAGLFASNGNVLYLVNNEENCAAMSIKTDFLALDTNVYVSAFNETSVSFKEGYYNSVEFRLSETGDKESNLSAFVHLCLTHASSLHGQGVVSFFDSLVLLFQLPREQHYKNLVGLMGELLLIEYIHQKFDLDYSVYWHTDGPSSQMDFVCPHVNLEVKSTVGESLCFTIKHDQLFSCPERNYLIAVVLEENNAGRTLEELITLLFEDHSYCNGMQFSINIEAEKRRISPVEMHNKRFILRKVYAYCANNINPFVTIPDYIEGLTYNFNLLPFMSEPLDEVIKVSST